MRSVLRPALTALAALLLPVTALAQRESNPTPRPQDVPVVAGERVGPITVRMRAEEMVALLGRPERVDRYPERNILSYDWKSEGYLVSFELSTGRVRVVGVYGTLSHFVTDRGIRLMMPLDRALRAYGTAGGYVRVDCRADRITLVRYHDLGLQFAAAYDPGQPIHGRIFNLGVFRPGSLRGEGNPCVTR
ncbi:MAG: hypothetical protein C4304_06215 [candidate division GAL15 bacterium]